MARLRDLLDGANGGGSDAMGDVGDWSSNAAGNDDEDDEDDGDVGSDARPANVFEQRNEENLAIDDAENPLQLLARASYFQPVSDQRRRDSPQSSRHRGDSAARQLASSKIQEFFSQTRAHLDIGEHVDPIDLGLVTLSEAASLYNL